jgi:PAT family beta-lactamase induction signal transducer AmpG
VTAEDARGRPPDGLRAKLLWIAAFYFASGFPFGVVNMTMPVYLRSRGVGLDEIGHLVGAAGAAWVFKFAWAPFVDRFGTRKHWIVGTQLLLGAGILAIALVDPARAGAVLFAVLVAIAVLSATQDISLDAYAIEVFEERELGPVNGVRVPAYRIGLLAASGLLVALAGVAGWSIVFVAGALVMLAIGLLSSRAPETPHLAARHEPLWRPLVALLELPHVWAVLLFVPLFKLGDSAMQVMAQTFLVDAGLSLAEIGTLGTLGIGAVIVGSLIGGWLITRWGIFRALWVLGLVQAFSNLGYWLAASHAELAWLVWAAKAFEDFSAGLGTAAFLAFLMSVCEKRYAATQFALLSALFGLTRQIAVWISGSLTQRMGYADYFLLTFVLAFPAFALLPWIHRMRMRRAAVPID